MAYDHGAIETRWQRYWETNRTFSTERRVGAKKAYILDMFPYPSGSGLHVGHPEGYTATDIVARHKRMQGYDVLHPMGWDAFGLPAEQHALKTGTDPRVTTERNIATFRKQLRGLGFSYDWSREINTTDPSYVRWTQWVFLKLFERGLAFQSEIPVNWCPELGTVLANEEIVDGVSDVGGYAVERRPLRQWQLRITAYADRLLSDLQGLDWPEATKKKQQEWIGRSEGAEVRFAVEGHPTPLAVYTTRPDTLFGVTYLVVAPDHPLTLALTTAAQRPVVERYLEATGRKSERERSSAHAKTGVDTGAFALHPLTGARLPVYTADYVLGGYGTGAVMAVPAHDPRDFDFAQALGLPVVEVVSPDGEPRGVLKAADIEPGIALASGPFSGLPTAECKRRIVERLEAAGAGQGQVNYKLRDWVFSRQRFWGEPIPIYFPVQTSGDPRAGAPYTIDYGSPVACSEQELPLLLPRLDDYRPGDPQGPLTKALDWRFFERDGKWFARETNTMPQWAGSCWYYLRYLDPHNSQALFDPQAYREWMPVDLYVGGAEHSVLHLLYARFWHKVLFDEGVVKHPEPFSRLVHQGMILGRVYRYYQPTEAGEALAGTEPVVPGSEPGTLRAERTGQDVRAVSCLAAESRGGRFYHPELGVEVVATNEKMSKSRGNVVNPDEIVAEFGADSLRIYEMFMGPLPQAKPWQSSGIQGAYRFLDRVNTVARRPCSDDCDLETSKLVHRTVKKVGADIEALRLNTAVSALMILANHLQGLEAPPKEALEKLVLCLSPFAPHLAEELWERLGHPPSISSQPWPTHDEALCEDAEVALPVQVNGKLRGKVVLSKEADRAQAEEAARADPGVAAAMAGKSLLKVIYVPGRVLNLVAR